MQRRWYPIQIYTPSTKEINPGYRQDHRLWCVLLSKHPQDYKKSDEQSIWWPYWNEYSTCNNTKQIIFGDRFLIRPNFTPSIYAHPSDYTDTSETLKSHTHLITHTHIYVRTHLCTNFTIYNHINS